MKNHKPKKPNYADAILLLITIGIIVMISLIQTRHDRRLKASQPDVLTPAVINQAN